MLLERNLSGLLFSVEAALDESMTADFNIVLLSKCLLTRGSGIYHTRVVLLNLNFSPSLATKYHHFGHSIFLLWKKCLIILKHEGLE